MSKKYKTAIVLICIIAVLAVAVGIVLKTQVFGAIKLQSAEIRVMELSNDIVFKTEKKYFDTYKTESDRISYVNDSCTFSSTDYRDYCIISVDITMKNTSMLRADMHSLSVKGDNDFIIFGTMPEKPGVRLDFGGGTDSCTYTFMCLKNGKSDEEIKNAMKDLTYKYTYVNRVFGEISFKLFLK